MQRLSEADTNKAAVLQYADAMMEARPGAPRSSVTCMFSWFVRAKSLWVLADVLQS